MMIRNKQPLAAADFLFGELKLVGCSFSCQIHPPSDSPDTMNRGRRSGHWQWWRKDDVSAGISSATSDAVDGDGASSELFSRRVSGCSRNGNRYSARRSIHNAREYPELQLHSSKSPASASSLNCNDSHRAKQNEPTRLHTPLKDINAQLPRSRQMSVSTRDEEFPPLAGSCGSSYPTADRRGSRIDLRLRIEQNLRSDDNTSKSYVASSANRYDGHPPAHAHSETRSSKNLMKEFKSHRQGLMNNPRSSSSSSPMGSNNIRPFDICLSRKRTLPPADAQSSEKGRLEEIFQSVEEHGQVLRPGMVLLKNYMTLREQVQIVNICRELGVGLGGFYQPSYPDGARLHLRMMCLGMNWDPVTREYEDWRAFDGSRPPDIPCCLRQLVERAIRDAHKIIMNDMTANNPENILPVISPNICIVNFYTTSGRLGLHQDRDESRESLRRGLPVISLTVGDSAEFLYGDTRDVDKAERLVLESGDVLIFRGKSRMVYHGVSSIYPDSAPKALLDEVGLRAGRLNLTFRQH